MPDRDRTLPPVPESRGLPRSRTRLSLVWFIPILAALVGVYVAVTRILAEGPVITIVFQSAEGLEVRLVPAPRLRNRDVDPVDWPLDRRAQALDPGRIERLAQADDAVAVVGDDVAVRDQAFCKTWTARLATRSLFLAP